MPKKEYLQFKIAEATKEKITIVASDETLDRYGEVVPLDSWDLRNYKSNPVLLVDHDYKISNIVGRAKNLKVSKDSFTFEPEFHNITQLAQEVSRMVDEGYAPAVSVGFLPHGPKKDGDKGSNELLEISFVAVGANPNALAMAMKSIDGAQEKKIEEWVDQYRPVIKNIFIHDKSGVRSIELIYSTGESEIFGADSDFVKGMDKLALNNKTELIEQVSSLTNQIAELKEGRVLSGKNRAKIEEGLSALKQTAAVLEDLLLATDPNTQNGADESKGRPAAGEHGPGSSKSVSPVVVRALQRISKDSNLLLRVIKD